METEKRELYKEKCRHVIEKLSLESSRVVPDYTKIDEIFTHYDKYNSLIKRNMVRKDSFTRTDPIIDNHKIAAAFFCSFLKARPLSYVPDSSGVPLSFAEERANEQGAFLFGLQVVQDFWADKFFDSVVAEDKEIYRNLIRLPKTDTDTYIHWFIKLVINGIEQYFDYKSDKFEEKFIFFISHIYSILDSYSYQHHKVKLYEKHIAYLNEKLAELSEKRLKKLQILKIIEIFADFL